jgi:hypothetical protein
MEAPMTTDPSHDREPRRPATGNVHARVYALLIFFAGWFAVAAWSFAGGGLSDYLLVIVSGFIFVVVALQLILSRVRRREDAGEQDRQPSWRDWTAFDFETWAGRLSGTQAAAQILMPIAAAAVGMTAFGIAFHIAERGGL